MRMKFAFIYCIAAHFLVTLFINKAVIFDLSSILVAMLAGAVMFDTYTPIEFKYGVVKARFVFTIVIFLFSMGPSLFMNLFGNVNFVFLALKTLSPTTKNTILDLGNILIIGISMLTSLKIFAEKEL
ncbi:MAG TPA: ABC-2 transporter permease [Clostridia bacterium]|nr:ABC-2 transporter permease [Clostridia bacterium]